jgi:hypothetical protein
MGCIRGAAILAAYSRCDMTFAPLRWPRTLPNLVANWVLNEASTDGMGVGRGRPISDLRVLPTTETGCGNRGLRGP